MQVNGIDLQIVTDSFHSVPSALRVAADGIDIGDFATGLVVTDSPRGTVASVHLPVETAAAEITLTAIAVDERLTIDWYSHVDHAMPISIAEVHLADNAGFSPALDIDTACRSDLVTVSGVPVAVRVAGTATDAVSRRQLTLTGCESLRAGGQMVVSTSPGSETGFDLDQMVLRSPRQLAERAAPAPITVVRGSDTSFTVDMAGSTSDRWLVLGQSRNAGWHATIDGVDLGPPVTIDGFANGWLIPAGGDLRVSLDWTPQRLVRWMVGLSAFSAMLAVWLVWRGREDRGEANSHSRSDGGKYPVIGPFPLIESVGGSPLQWPTAIAVGAGVSLFALVNLPQWPVSAGAIGLLVLFGLRVRRVGSLAAVAAALSLGFASLYIMIQQRRFRYPPVFVWPQQFERVHILGVLAILLIAAEYVRSAVSPSGDPKPDPDPDDL